MRRKLKSLGLLVSLGLFIIAMSIAVNEHVWPTRLSEAKVPVNASNNVDVRRRVLPSLDLTALFDSPLQPNNNKPPNVGKYSKNEEGDFDSAIQTAIASLDVKALTPKDQLTDKQKSDLAKVLVTYDMNERTVLATTSDKDETQRLLANLREDTLVQLRVRTTAKQWEALEHDTSIARIYRAQ